MTSNCDTDIVVCGNHLASSINCPIVSSEADCHSGCNSNVKVYPSVNHILDTFRMMFAGLILTVLATITIPILMDVQQNHLKNVPWLPAAAAALYLAATSVLIILSLTRINNVAELIISGGFVTAKTVFEILVVVSSIVPLLIVCWAAFKPLHSGVLYIASGLVFFPAFFAFMVHSLLAGVNKTCNVYSQQDNNTNNIIDVTAQDILVRPLALAAVQTFLSVAAVIFLRTHTKV